MQTRFSTESLADPAMAASEAVIRKCVHCGFCMATCPTYLLLGDELDGPRGRIYLMKEMLENARQPTAEVVKHIDRCLSCNACVTTCPSGVNYANLVDHARAYIEARYRRPLLDRVLRALLAWVLPHPGRFRLALRLARAARPLTAALMSAEALKPIVAMLDLAHSTRPLPHPLGGPPPPVGEELASAPLNSSPTGGRGSRNGGGGDAHGPANGPIAGSPPHPAKGVVALLQGCAEPVLRPQIRAAAVRVLGRAGYDVVFAQGEVCCAALVRHMGREAAAQEAARRNIDAWSRLDAATPLTAIITTTAGCGAQIKDYGFMLRGDPAYAHKAARISVLARDVSEFLGAAGLPAGDGRGLKVAYQAACSLQHGQKITDAPVRLLRDAGFEVTTPKEAHLCCGSAGVYNILQPDIAGQLGERKAASLDALGAAVIATGNIGCAVQISRYSDGPVAHVVELLDWAAGGMAPAGLSPVDDAQ